MANQTPDQKAANEKKEPVKASANVQPQAEVDPIMIEVTNTWDIREGVKLLLMGVASEIQLAKDDPNAVEKVASRLKERCGSYGDALTANTGYAEAYHAETEKGRKEREDKEKHEKVEKK